MRVFVTGASGFIGSAVVRELMTGYQVLGLARSEESAVSLNALGVDVHLGSLEDAESLRSGAQAADAVIHLGFNPNFSTFRENCQVDQRAIEVIGSAIAGSSKPLIVPNGIAGLAPSGTFVTERDDIPEDYRFPRVSEQTALRLAAQGIAATVIRLPQVHSVAKQGLVTRLIQIAREKRTVAYIGEGTNRWPAAHVSDVARLFRLVMEAGKPGAKYHAVAEEGIQLQTIASAISRILGLPVQSLTPAEAQEHFGPMSMFVGEDMPASGAATKASMGWRPNGPSLIQRRPSHRTSAQPGR